MTKQTAMGVLLSGWEDKKRPFQTIKKLTRQERIFTLLLWVGVPGADAYRAAFETNASRSSAAQMASRLAQSENIVFALEHLWDKLLDGKINFKS